MGEAARRGKLVRLGLYLDGRPIALLVNIVSPPASFGFKTAFDQEFSSYSPGVLLEHEYLATLDRKDIHWCDSCASPDHNVLGDLWTARRSIGRLSFGIGGSLRRTLYGQILQVEMNRLAERRSS